MLDNSLTSASPPATSVQAGSVLLRRGEVVERIVHVLQGRVLLGVMSDHHMAHPLGVVHGPSFSQLACSASSMQRFENVLGCA